MVRDLRSLPRAAYVLFAGTFVNRFGTFVFVFLALYLASHGYSPSEAGLAVSAYGVGSLASTVIGGAAADRLGRKNAIAISMFGSAASVMALSQAESLIMITLLTGAFGLASELYRPAAAALLTDLTPPGNRVAAFAAYRLAINLGFAAGPAVAGLLASESFFFVFLGDALTSLIFGIVALIALPHGVRSARGPEQHAQGTTLDALRDRQFALFLIAMSASAFVYFQSQSALPLHIRDAGYSTAAFGALLSINGLIVVLLELPIASITRRLNATRVIATAFVLVGFGFGLNSVAHALPLLALSVAVWTLGEIVGAPVAQAYVADLAPEHLRGRYQGLLGLTFSIGLIVGPALGTYIYAANPNALWVTCAGLGVVSATMVLFTPRRRARPVADVLPGGPEVPGTET